MKRIKFLVGLNTFGFALTILLNALANALPINGKTTGQLSDMYPNLFVPAGITFSIWGVLYLLLLANIIYQWIAVSSAPRDTGFISRIGYWFFVSSLANSSWILAWHFMQPELSLIIMLVLFLSLVKIYLDLRIEKEPVSRAEQFFIRVCFSAYLGWISVALIANVTAVLVGLGWSGGGFGASGWTILMISAAAALGIYFSWKFRDYAYALVIVWALFGIYLKRSVTIPIESGVVFAAQAGILLISLMIIYQFISSRISIKTQ
jgi:hypothetical protein